MRLERNKDGKPPKVIDIAGSGPASLYFGLRFKISTINTFMKLMKTPIYKTSYQSPSEMSKR